MTAKEIGEDGQEIRTNVEPPEGIPQALLDVAGKPLKDRRGQEKLYTYGVFVLAELRRVKTKEAVKLGDNNETFFSDDKWRILWLNNQVIKVTIRVPKGHDGPTGPRQVVYIPVSNVAYMMTDEHSTHL